MCVAQYTQQESNKLGLKGWCMNTEHGTVQGVIQGDVEKINDMLVLQLLCISLLLLFFTNRSFFLDAYIP